ncbi:MAG: hypothetical protein Q7R87_02395, partial [Nanoarchaeota archaeon]|nr:hypothetical protein [Nanoarchaeota archaeon]
LVFSFNNNSIAFQLPIENLIPIGKVIASNTKNHTQLQSELRERLNLSLRQRRNLEASFRLPEENAFVHGGDLLEDGSQIYRNLLVISGHMNK